MQVTSHRYCKSNRKGKELEKYTEALEVLKLCATIPINDIRNYLDGEFSYFHRNLLDDVAEVLMKHYKYKAEELICLPRFMFETNLHEIEAAMDTMTKDSGIRLEELSAYVKNPANAPNHENKKAWTFVFAKAIISTCIACNIPIEPVVKRYAMDEYYIYATGMHTFFTGAQERASTRAARIYLYIVRMKVFEINNYLSEKKHKEKTKIST